MTIETVDRTLFELVRKAVVAATYLPDVTSYGNTAAYTTAKDVLRAQKADKQLIDVFGVGAPESREEKSVCKIIIDRQGYAKGTIGGFPASMFEKKMTGPNTYVFDKLMMPSEAKNIRYTIRCISNFVSMDRIMLQLMEDVFGGRLYTKTIDSSYVFNGDPILVDLLSTVDVTSGKLLEKLFTFVVPDVWLSDPKVISQNIPPMSTVTAAYHYEFGYNGSSIYESQVISE